MWGVRVFRQVGMCMVQAMHEAVSVSTYVRRALCDEATYVEYTLPGTGHGEHIMCSIPVMKYGLKK